MLTCRRLGLGPRSRPAATFLLRSVGGHAIRPFPAGASGWLTQEGTAHHMSFFEDLAAALDSEGIESRVGGDVLFAPITAEVEIQFVEIDRDLPAANVYIAAADVDEDDEEFSAALVAVVFSVADAVRTVAAHVAIDQVITILKDLLDGTDERIGDLEFIQDAQNPNLVRAEVGKSSELQVVVEAGPEGPRAEANFVTVSEDYEDIVDAAIDELWESSDEVSPVLSEEDRQNLFAHLADEAAAASQEVLTLGSFSDFDKLFDVLSLAADNAESWEEQLLPLDGEDEDYEVFDLFGADSDDDAGDAFDDDADEEPGEGLDSGR